LPTHPHEEPEDSEKQPPGDPTIWSRCERHDGGGEGEVDGRRDEHLAATDLVRDPAPEEGSGNGAETGRQQDHRPLPIRQLPLLGDEGEDVADQKEIEKVQQVGKISGHDQLPLVRRQFLLMFQ